MSTLPSQVWVHLALPGAPGAHPSPGFAHTTGAEITLVLLGVVALAAGAAVVTSRVVVHAALWLVVTLGALAGMYLTLTAEFVAWVQVLIYVGAVVVLLLFGAMLTKAPTAATPDLDSGNRLLAAAVATGCAGLLTTLLGTGFAHAYVALRGRPGSGAADVGLAVFRGYLLPFEVVSVLLLAALVGAVVLSRGDVE